MEDITVYLYFLWLSAHLSFLLSVSCQSLCLHALPDKSKTPSLLWVCACPFLSVCVSLCAVWWQWVTVSNGPDLEVGMHLLCMCLCMCVGARQIVLCACVCVCVCLRTMMVTVERELGGALLRSVLMPLSLLGLVPFSQLPLASSKRTRVGVWGGWNQSPILRGWPSSPGHRYQSKCHGC